MNTFLFPSPTISIMLAELFTALFTLNFAYFIGFFISNLALIFALIILAALLWQSIRSIYLVVFSGLAAMALIDLVSFFNLSFNFFHFFIAFLFVVIVFETDKNPKDFLLVLFSLALFFAFFQLFL